MEEQYIKLLDEYVEKKLANRKGPYYNIVIGEQEITLGKSKVDAGKALTDLITAGKLSPLTPTGIKEAQNPLATSTEDNDSEESVLNALLAPIVKSKKELEATDEEDLQALLGKIIDIKPSNYIDTDVLYKGVHFMDKDNPVMKALPVVFRWRKRGENNANVIDDGQGNLSCNNWQVLMKDRHTLIFKHLKFMRNETPNSNYATNGDLVLCIASKALYEKLQREKSIQGLIDAKRDKEKRQEIGKNISRLDDESQAIDLLESANSSDESMLSRHESDLEKLRAEL